MKKTLTIATITLLSFASKAQLGQVPNPGFENWTTTNVYDYTTTWGSSNEAEWQGTPTVLKSTDAFLGTYSAELTKLTVNTNDAFGYVYLGGLSGGPTPDFSYTPNFDTLKFNYKANITGGDVYVVLVRSLFNTESAPEIIQANVVTQSSWTEAVVTIPPGVQDEMFLGIVMGDPFNSNFPVDGSWVKIDNIRLFDGATAVSALPDFSLENWSTLTNEGPDSWNSLNVLQNILVSPSVTKTTDIHSGSFAVRMENKVSAISGDTTIALLSLAPLDGSSASIPYAAATPSTFSGWYKYTNTQADTASIQVLFYQGATVVCYHLELLTSAAAYTQFSSPLTFLGTPDSIQILVTAGLKASSVLFLDDLAFTGGGVGVDEMVKMNISLYPNPANNEVSIFTEGVFDFSIYTTQGQIVASQTNNNSLQKISLLNIQAGTYFVKIANDKTTTIQKLIVE